MYVVVHMLSDQSPVHLDLEKHLYFRVAISKHTSDLLLLTLAVHISHLQMSTFDLTEFFKINFQHILGNSVPNTLCWKFILIKMPCDVGI